MDWDDLKVFLALSRKGSARQAAQELGVSNSTVTRRLDDMERKLQTHLFDRTPDGYRMTGAGEQVLSTAEHVEELVLGIERKITGGDRELRGSIRLTFPPAGSLGFLMKRIARFAQEYPGIDLELMSSSDNADLSRREADIAVRVLPAGTKPPEYLIGRHLAAMTASTYVHRDLLNPDAPQDVSHLTWIGKRSVDQKEEWLADTDYPGQPVRHAIVDFRLLADAVRYQMGMALLPCFMAFNMPDLVRVPGARIIHQMDMWVLTHKDLRLSARLRVLRELIAEEFDKVRGQLDSRLGVSAGESLP
ncbi:MAG: LysR family transcriptional regulator [Halieaceae bacterium]|nr:LysR family transcriptional regulator [Halieaceae bacterium]MCP5165148.1 LysR family transcriptional regulator [Pseudomonadales bacterium]MCP5202746.1 LysR family transcriptional regulator [Pseudomonadales bacterium]